MATPTTVELDVWSGRPNPTWTLSLEEGAELEKRLHGLEPAERGKELPGLGYRGFVLEGPAREIRVFGGTITVTEEGGSHSFVDSHGLESWLKGLAAEQGHGGLMP